MLHTLPRVRALDIRRPVYFCLQPWSYADSGATARRVPRNCARRPTTVTN